VERNHFRRCTLVPVGLSSRVAVVTLLSNSGAAVDHSASIVEGFRRAYTYDRREVVPVFSGDELVGQLGIEKVAVVKVDVEGGELEVLEGMSNLLARDRPYVFCEVLPTADPTTETGAFRLSRQVRLAELLGRHEYAIFRLLLDGRASAGLRHSFRDAAVQLRVRSRRRSRSISGRLHSCLVSRPGSASPASPLAQPDSCAFRPRRLLCNLRVA
jgi:FkbM family methyltransferase